MHCMIISALVFLLYYFFFYSNKQPFISIGIGWNQKCRGVAQIIKLGELVANFLIKFKQEVDHVTSV